MRFSAGCNVYLKNYTSQFVALALAEVETEQEGSKWLAFTKNKLSSLFMKQNVKMMAAHR